MPPRKTEKEPRSPADAIDSSLLSDADELVRLIDHELDIQNRAMLAHRAKVSQLRRLRATVRETDKAPRGKASPGPRAAGRGVSSNGELSQLPRGERGVLLLLRDVGGQVPLNDIVSAAQVRGVIHPAATAGRENLRTCLRRLVGKGTVARSDAGFTLTKTGRRAADELAREIGGASQP